MPPYIAVTRTAGQRVRMIPLGVELSSQATFGAKFGQFHYDFSILCRNGAQKRSPIRDRASSSLAGGQETTRYLPTGSLNVSDDVTEHVPNGGSEQRQNNNYNYGY